MFLVDHCGILFSLQTMEPEMFIDNPILFGDFLKMGADKADKMYEELNDFAKLRTILNDVSIDFPLSLHHLKNLTLITYSSYTSLN